MSNIATRMDVHFTALAAVGAVAAIGGAQKAEASVVYSGVLNTPIGATIDGLYVNLVSGATGTSGGSVAGWDINPYVSGGTWTEFAGSSGSTFIGSAGAVTDATGVLIDAAASYVGASPFAASFSTTAIMGVKFTGNDSLTHYGWVRLTLPGAGGTATGGTLVDYAYDSTPDTGIVGGVPAPTAGMAVLALGGVGLIGRRRK